MAKTQFHVPDNGTPSYSHSMLHDIQNVIRKDMDGQDNSNKILWHIIKASELTWSRWMACSVEICEAVLLLQKMTIDW
jgi:hypothetical protein